MSTTLRLMVARVHEETRSIRSFLLRAPDGSELPAFEPGAHVDLHLPNDLVRQYSMANHPNERRHYLLGVLREAHSRGGSRWLHENLCEGLQLEVGQPRNNFPLVAAHKTLLIAGGIGVTPLLAMANELHLRGADFELHYCTRSREDTAFMPLIEHNGWAERVRLIHDGGDPCKGIDLSALLTQPDAGRHVYCCGPAGLMNAVRAASSHWPNDTVHFEWFGAVQSEATGASQARAFTVVLGSSGKEFLIPAHRSIVEVLRDAGVTVEALCEQGVCGTCVTSVMEGEPDHHDSVLTEEERRSEGLMTICCSRARSARLVLDL